LLSFSVSDFHPPLFYILLKYWMRLFGTSEIIVRLPSVIFSLLAIIVIYIIGKKLYDKKTAFVSSILLATSPLYIYYSQEARMYMLASLLTALSVLFFVLLLEQDKIKYWVGFILSTAVLLYTDYLPYLMLPTYALYLFIVRKKTKGVTLKSFIPALILITAFCIPLFIYIFPKQIHGGLNIASRLPAWASVVGGSTPKDLALVFIKFTIGRISLDDKVLYAILLVPLAGFIGLLFSVSWLRISTKRSFVWFWFLLPITFSFIISFFIPVFSYFRLIFVLPAFYLILASAITNLNWSLPTRVMLSIMLVINLSCSFIYLINPKFHREDWKSATSYVQQNSTNNTIVMFESTNSIAPFVYYNNDFVQAWGVLDSINPDPTNVQINVNKFLDGSNKVYLFQYLSPITDPQGLVYTSLTNAGFSNTATKDFNGVGFVYEFTR